MEPTSKVQSTGSPGFSLNRFSIIVGLLLGVVLAVGVFSLHQISKLQDEIELLGSELIKLSSGVSSLIAAKTEIFYILEQSESSGTPSSAGVIHERARKVGDLIKLVQDTIARIEQRDRGQLHDLVLIKIKQAIGRISALESLDVKLLPLEGGVVVHSDSRLNRTGEFNQALDHLRLAVDDFANDALMVSRRHQEIAMLEIAGFTIVAFILAGLLILQIRRIQLRLFDVEKLALLGKTAVTLHHEINNPLTVIVGNSELLLSPSVSSTQREDLIDGIKQMSKRIAHVVQRVGEVEKVLTKEYIDGVEMLDLESSKRR